MTEEQKAKRIHAIVYSCDSREELAERIVRLEDEGAKLRELVSLYHYGATHEASPSDVLAWSAKVDSLRRELEIEVDK